MMNRVLFVALTLWATHLNGQNIESIAFGNMDSWRVREIKESAILGGQTKSIYAIAPTDTISGVVAYVPTASPWATSNVLAIVSGVTKTSNTVFAERRGSGSCARMETMLVTCKVLGMINISVVASGSIYLGRTMEPIRNTSNPYTKLDMGVAYTRRPEALMFDYHALMSDNNTLTKATGVSVSTFSGRDPAEIFILLQHRSEDAKGNICAKRVGTARMMIDRSTGSWVNQHKLPLIYGPQGASVMKLQSTYHARNTKGVMVPVVENQWADEDAQPTHMIVMFSSGSRGAYTGAVGNKLRIDNVKLLF